MTPRLPKMLSRGAALALLCGLLAVVWALVIAPVVESSNTAAVSRGIALRALKRNRALLKQGDAVAAARAAVEQSPRWRNFYEGPKVEAATLQLEADIRALLRDSNNPASIVAEPASVRGPIARIAVKVSFSARVDQLAQMLDRIQKATRQLRIESLVVQAPEFQAGEPNPVLSIQAEIAAMTTAGVPQQGAT